MDPNAVGFLTGNLVLNLSILAWAAAQFIKFFLVLITERRLSWSHILSSGGMPSSHSSTVCACASALACLYGTSSPHFAVSTVLAAVVMYDACKAPQLHYGELERYAAGGFWQEAEGDAGPYTASGADGGIAGHHHRMGWSVPVRLKDPSLLLETVICHFGYE